MIEILKKVKNINNLDWFFICMKFISILLVCLIPSIVTLVVIGTIIKVLDGFLGLAMMEWISIVGTVISGLFGVYGGIFSSRYEMKCNEQQEFTNTINSIGTLIKSEININNEILTNNKQDKKLEFDLSQWENLKFEIIKLERKDEYANLARSISDLYRWLEYSNRLINMNQNIDRYSKSRLYTKISTCMLDANKEIDNHLGITRESVKYDIATHEKAFNKINTLP